jgi:uncharacterized protein YggE
MRAKVRVEGSATAAALPDRGDITIEVSEVGKTPQEALAAAGERADRVASLVRAAGVPDADWRTSGVLVAEESRWKNAKRVVLGHRASARFAVKVHDAATANTVVAGAAEAGAALAGPNWTVAPDNAARVEAYQAAARDAQVRAVAYAQALGLRLAGVLKVEELGGRGGGFVPVARPMAVMADAGGAPEPVHLGEVEVSASVTVTFALDAPV